MTKLEFLTPRECAQLRRCSLRKLDRERASGIGPAFIRDNGRILYSRADVDQHLLAHRRGGEDRAQRAAAA